MMTIAKNFFVFWYQSGYLRLGNWRRKKKSAPNSVACATTTELEGSARLYPSKGAPMASSPVELTTKTQNTIVVISISMMSLLYK